MSELQWEVIEDTMRSFQSHIRLRQMDGWALHSWQPFVEMRGGGRITPYPEQMVCSVWTKCEVTP